MPTGVKEKMERGTSGEVFIYSVKDLYPARIFVKEGMSFIIDDVTIDETEFGETAIFTTEIGEEYLTTAVALVNFAKRLMENPDCLPMRVKIITRESARGRRYLWVE